MNGLRRKGRERGSSLLGKQASAGRLLHLPQVEGSSCRHRHKAVLICVTQSEQPGLFLRGHSTDGGFGGTEWRGDDAGRQVRLNAGRRSTPGKESSRVLRVATSSECTATADRA